MSSYTEKPPAPRKFFVALRVPFVLQKDKLYLSKNTERGRYFTMVDYNSAEYKRSRAAYMAQCTTQYLVSLLVTDAFLAKLLTYIGISDFLTGVISSFISMAFVFQLLSIFLVKLKLSTKKLVITFDTISIFFFMLLYLIPFLPVNQQHKTVLVIVSVIAAYIGNYLISSICFQWANSYVDPEKRASYSASKEMISLVSGMAFTMIIGYIIDRYEGLGNQEGGFLFIAVSILILNICNFINYMLIKKESDSQRKENSHPFSEVIENTMGNKNFRNIVILTIMWDVARYFTIGFIGVFKTKDLMISVFLIQVINMAANFLRMLVSKPFGKYSDKHSYAKGFKLGLYLAAAAFFINIFTTNSSWFLIILFTVLLNCSYAGTNQNSFNIIYSYVDSKYITQAMAIKNSIGGICGFAASILAGRLLASIQANGNHFFNITVYGQQVLSAVSFVIMAAAIVFTAKVIEKQKIMIQ